MILYEMYVNVCCCSRGFNTFDICEVVGDVVKR